MISIPQAGGYDKLVYSDLPECGYTTGANVTKEGMTFYLATTDAFTEIHYTLQLDNMYEMLLLKILLYISTIQLDFLLLDLKIYLKGELTSKYFS